jgi:hypothetical protein
LSTTAGRTPFLTAIPISDIGIWSTISQAITAATLCLTADAGRMAMPMCATTSEITVEISAVVCETPLRAPHAQRPPRVRLRSNALAVTAKLLVKIRLTGL